VKASGEGKAEKEREEIEEKPKTAANQFLFGC
jgi:hypothetical protein